MGKLKERAAQRNQQYRAASVVNQIIPFLADELESLIPGRVFSVKGLETKQFRETNSLEKTHENDAYCIACCTLQEAIGVRAPREHFEIQQFRRHDRARIKAQTERHYYLDGEKVATNRRKRMDQKTDALEDWYQKQVEQYGVAKAEKMRSSLKVKKSMRRYNNPDRLMPGAVFRPPGSKERYVLTSQITKGQYYRAASCGNRNFPAAKSEILCQNRGLVTIGVCR